MPPASEHPRKSPTIADALRQGDHSLKRSRVQAPRLIAEVLLCQVLGKEKSFLYAHPEQRLQPEQWRRFVSFVERRREGVPTQYITGVQEFYGLSFKVNPDVLIPRPETEHLVEETLARASGTERILDVGAGSGCVGVAIKKNLHAAAVLACEVSRAALRVAVENSDRLGAAIDFVQANLVEAFTEGSFDMVVCNPPYVPLADLPGLQQELRSEPGLALFGGEDGLEVYRGLTATAARVLRPGGWLLVELGYRVRPQVETLLSGSGWGEPYVKADLAGIDRVLVVRRV